MEYLGKIKGGEQLCPQTVLIILPSKLTVIQCNSRRLEVLYVIKPDLIHTFL